MSNRNKAILIGRWIIKERNGMDIEFQLDKIFTDLSFPKYKDMFYLGIINTMDTIFKNEMLGKDTAIVCGGKHTLSLMQDFPSRFYLCDIIDENPEKLKERNSESNIYDYDNIENYDLLIISSYEYKNDVKKKLKERNFTGRILDIYEELKEKNIILSKEYYHYKRDPYSRLIALIGRLESTENNEKPAILSEIICLFIRNKDIFQAKQYIIKYLEADYPQKEKYKIALQKLEKLEKSISDKLHEKKKRDIICFWQDGLRYSTSKMLPYLNQCRKEGIDFINAYSIAAWSTRSTYGGMMERTDEISLFLYERGRNQVADMLQEKGYKAYRVGAKEGKAVCENLENFDYKESVLGDYSVPSAALLWEMLKVLLLEKDPVFLIVHSTLETHEPFYAPTLKNCQFDYQLDEFRLASPENLRVFEDNILASAKYLDDENKYISSILPDNIVKIYMSDHGCPMSYTSQAYKEEMSHIPFVVVGDQIPHIVEKDLFILRKFYEVIYYIITMQKYEKICDDYLLINGIDFYGENAIQWIIDTYTADVALQFVGVRTSLDMYIYRATGDECYYLFPDESNNLINNKRYASRIAYLKSLVKKEMIDIYKVDKFKYSYRLYDSIGKTICLNSNSGIS